MNNTASMPGRYTTHTWRAGRGLRLAFIATMFIALSACAVGPDFVPPAAPNVKSYTAREMPTQLSAGDGGVSQELKLGHEITAQWWELYQSPQLNQLLTQAIKASPDLSAARARLAQAQQTLYQVEGGYYPQVDVNANARRQQTSASSTGVATTSNLYSLGAVVSYNLDLFGSTQRQVEQAAAQAENQRYQLAAAYLTLTGNVVTQALSIAGVRQQINALNDIIADDENNLRLVRLKFQAGKATRTDVLTAESQLTNDLVLLPPLKDLLSRADHALAVLIGEFPGDWSAPAFELTDFNLPGELPISIPSALVRQRPDILAAEAQLHVSSAAIGIASAQLYPNVTLSGSIGTQSSSGGSLFQASNQFWSLVASLTAPIFHGGALEAQKQAAVYAFEASAASYQKTVLTAFGQVADVMRTLQHDAEFVSAGKNALQTADASLKLTRLSYAAGKADLLQLIDAQRAYQQARIVFARAQSQRYQDSVQLFVAMGGGWWQDKHYLSLETPPVQTNAQTDKTSQQK